MLGDGRGDPLAGPEVPEGQGEGDLADPHHPVGRLVDLEVHDLGRHGVDKRGCPGLRDVSNRVPYLHQHLARAFGDAEIDLSLGEEWLDVPELEASHGTRNVGHAFLHGGLYPTTASVPESPQYGLLALLRAANSGDRSVFRPALEYARRARIMKRLFLDNGFRLVYDNDMGQPLADGFYFTVAYPGFDQGSELLLELLPSRSRRDPPWGLLLIQLLLDAQLPRLWLLLLAHGLLHQVAEIRRARRRRRCLAQHRGEEVGVARRWLAGQLRAAYWSSARLSERLRRLTLWGGVLDDVLVSSSSSCPRRSRRAFWLAFLRQALWEPGFLPIASRDGAGAARAAMGLEQFV